MLSINALRECRGVCGPFLGDDGVSKGVQTRCNFTHPSNVNTGDGLCLQGMKNVFSHVFRSVLLTDSG